MTFKEFLEKAPKDNYVEIDDVFVYKVNENKYFDSENLEIRTIDLNDFDEDLLNSEIEINLDGKDFLRKEIEDWLSLKEYNSFTKEEQNIVDFYRNILDEDSLNLDLDDLVGIEYK